MTLSRIVHLVEYYSKRIMSVLPNGWRQRVREWHGAALGAGDDMLRISWKMMRISSISLWLRKRRKKDRWKKSDVENAFERNLFMSRGDWRRRHLEPEPCLFLLLFNARSTICLRGERLMLLGGELLLATACKHNSISIFQPVPVLHFF